MELARGEPAREVGDEGVGELVDERPVELGRQGADSPPIGMRMRPSKES